MATFFEKLKKGMEVEEPLPIEEIPKEKKKKTKKAKKPEKETKISKEVEDLKKKIIKVKEEPSFVPPSGATAGKEKKWLEPEGQLVVDIYQTDKEIVIQSAIAGVKPENLDISIENDMVIIKGVREKPFEQEERNYFYQECHWGPFSREIILPEEVDNSRIQASIKEGILTIRIPKIERKKKRKVTVKE